MTHREMLQAVIDSWKGFGIYTKHKETCLFALNLSTTHDTDSCPGCRAVVLLRSVETELAKEPAPDDRVYVHRALHTRDWIVMRHGRTAMICPDYATADSVMKAVCETLDVKESQVVFQ